MHECILQMINCAKFKLIKCTVVATQSSAAVFPLRPYVAKLAQHFGNLAQQILWKCLKKMSFPVFSLDAIILTQELPQFCEIL